MRSTNLAHETRSHLQKQYSAKASEVRNFEKKAKYNPDVDIPAPWASENFMAQTVPVYAKIHKKYLDVETLMYYKIPWEWDRVSR